MTTILERLIIGALGFSALYATPAFAENWVYLTDDKDSESYYDTESIQRLGKQATLWMQTISREKTGPIREIKALVRFDCEAKTSSIRKWITIDRTGKSETLDVNDAPTDVGDNPVDLKMLSVACTVPISEEELKERTAKYEQQKKDVGQFLEGLRNGSEEALKDRTARYEQLERAIDNPKEMRLGCVFKDGSGLRDFRIRITNIIEPEEDYGTSLMWRGTAYLEGRLPPNIVTADEAVYGGPPEDIHIWFEASDVALHKVAGGLASEYQEGLIRCEVVSGAGFLY